MSEKMISRGKTLNQAIDTGLHSLKLKKSQVDIEIIRHESKRLFGVLGTRPAVVRISKKKDISKIDIDIDLQDSIQSLEQRKNVKDVKLGMAWVKDGQIYCKETPNHYPTITPTKGISLYKNGELVKKTTVIMEKDQIKIELKTDLKEPSWSISLDSLKMEATLKLELGYRKTYKLIDQKPNSHICLEVKQQEEIFNPLQLIHIEQRMKGLGIRNGIQRVEIQKAMEARESGEFIIAKGLEPTKGEDGWIEPVLDTKLENNRLNLLESGYVDFRKVITLFNVKAGELLAIIHHPKPGKMGYSVTGEVLKPELSREMIVHAGKGVDIVDKGTKIVAVDSGRLSIKYKEVKAIVSIIPRFIHSGDVNISSGNIRYHGDLEIQGNVNEGMALDTLCDLFIHGTVDNSKLTAGNCIIICQNVFNSILEAGKSNQMALEIGHSMRKISSELKGFSLAVDQVYKSPVFKTSDIAKMGLSSLIKILLEKKYKTLPPLIKELNELILKAEKLQVLDPEIKEIQSDLNNGFLNHIPSQFQDAIDILTLAERMNHVHELFGDGTENDAKIIIPYALNSELSCCGDISIIGKGCINSTVHSEGKVKINGILRGGEIYAARGVEADAAGAKGGLITRIHVPNGQTIKINHVMQGTVIQIGNQTYQFDREEENVFARETSEGRILLF